MDPACVAMHELLHTARMDHMGMAGNYFFPIGVGERPNNRRLTAMDITALQGAAGAGVNRARRERVAPNADMLITPEATLDVSENGIAGMGTLSFGHSTDLTVPEAKRVFDGQGMPVDAKVIWGGNMLLEGSLALGTGSLGFQLYYPDRALLAFYPGQGVLESTLVPVVFDPSQERWISGVFSSSSFDPATNTISFGSSSSSLQSYLSSDGRLIVGAAGLVPELPGDYNQDNVVDAADYVVWRKNNGTNNTLPNDLIGGTIGQAHFDQWRANFGTTAGSGSLSDASVPEPASVWLLILGAVVGARTGRQIASHVPSTR
jgi:hypothetical protein